MMPLLYFFLLLFWCSIASSETINDQLDKLIEEKLPQATVAVQAIDADSEKVIYTKNSNKLLSPASNIKLFTAAAALYYLGPQFKFYTLLSQKNDDVFLSFSGSPSLTSEDLKALVMHLKKTHPTGIKGNLIIDDTRFKPPFHPSGISYDDLGWYYVAPSSSIVLDENMETYEFMTNEKIGELISIKSITKNPVLALINQVNTVTPEEAKNRCSLHVKLLPKNTTKLYGCLAQSKSPRRMQLALSNPRLVAKKVIQQALAQNEIPLKSEIKFNTAPKDTQYIASFESKPLLAMINHMLTESDNLYADNITKQLGYSLLQGGTYKEGANAIKKILSEHTPIKMKSLELVDGQGTRYNLTTVEQIMSLLLALHKDAVVNPMILEALPRMGVSGTLKDRMKKTPLENKVMAKTGHMHDISALSGYLTTDSGKTIIFSIVINGLNHNMGLATQLENELLLQLAKAI